MHHRGVNDQVLEAASVHQANPLSSLDGGGEQPRYTTLPEHLAPARKGGRIDRQNVLHELLSAEELEVGVLNPLHQDRSVRELEGVLQIQKPDGETGPGRRSAGVGRKAFGVVALVRLPVDQACEHDDRMVHVENVLQPVHQHVGCPGWGIMGFMGASSFLAFEP